MRDFLTVEEVQEICGIKVDRAYKIIRTINKEMEEKGFLIISGRVNRKFFMKKMGLD